MQGYVHGISGLFSDFGPDGFGHPENVSRRFHTHKTAVVWFTVKCCMNLDASPAEFRPDVIGKINIGAVNIGHLLQCGITT